MKKKKFPIKHGLLLLVVTILLAIVILQNFGTKKDRQAASFTEDQLLYDSEHESVKVSNNGFIWLKTTILRQGKDSDTYVTSYFKIYYDQFGGFLRYKKESLDAIKWEKTEAQPLNGSLLPNGWRIDATSGAMQAIITSPSGATVRLDNAIMPQILYGTDMPIVTYISSENNMMKLTFIELRNENKQLTINRTWKLDSY